MPDHSFYVANTPSLSIYYQQLIMTMGEMEANDYLNQSDILLFIPINEAWTNEFMKIGDIDPSKSDSNFFTCINVPWKRMDKIKKRYSRVFQS